MIGEKHPSAVSVVWPLVIAASLLAAGYLVFGLGVFGIATKTTTLAATEDTFVNSGDPTKIYGQSGTVQSDAKPGNKVGLLRFRLGEIPEGATIHSAVLRLFVINASKQPVDVFSVNGEWNESTTSWSNRPQPGQPLANIQTGGRNRIQIQTSLGSLPWQGEFADLLLVTDSADGASFSSSEKGSNPPTLVVQWSVPSTPVATSTPSPAISPAATATATATPQPTASPTAVPTIAPTPTSAPTAVPPGPTGFVTAGGRALFLNGQPYRFIGVNRYNLAAANGLGCGSSWTESQLEAWFAELKSATDANAVRFWLFQSNTAGGTDFSRFDKLLEMADRYGMKVMPTFENQWESCTQGGYKYNTWYRSGYTAPYGSYPVSFREYVGRVVTRYANDPRILAWQLMNEAESKDTGGSEDPGALYGFAQDMSAYVKSLDPNHLLSLGTMGGGQPGQRGASYLDLHSLPGIDLLEFHDYDHEGEAIPANLAARIADSVTLNKPIFVGEAGIKSGCSDSECFAQQQRAEFFHAKIQGLLGAGGAGYLIWSYRDRDGASEYQFTADDPLAAVVKNLLAP